jgi:deazaflavin-dependent oxidoreductase (nitroreductase family)
MPDLRDIAPQKTVRLITRGRKSGEPRAVTIWFVVAGPRSILVQHASRPAAQWYKNLLSDPNVQLDFGAGPLPATARPLGERREIDDVLRQIRRKYWSGWLIQLLFGRGATPVAAEITLAAGVGSGI